MQIFSFHYSGTGVQQSLTPAGLKWQPNLAIVKGRTTQAAVARITGMGTGSVNLSGGVVSGPNAQGIISLDAQGITVGTDATVNSNGVTYDVILVQDNGAKDFNFGSYTGNSSGAGTQTINLPSMTSTPDCVIVLPQGSTSDPATWVTSDMAAGSSQSFGAALSANIITAIGAGTFSVGTANAANRNLESFFYVAFKSTTNLFAHFSYTGNGTAQTVPSSPFGFTPTNALVKASTTTATGVVKYAGESGTNSMALSATGEASQQVTAFGSGTVNVGSSALTNANTVVYNGIAFRDTPLVTNAQTGMLLGVGP